MHAGPEIGVAATKSFTSQLTILTLLALLFGRIRVGAGLLLLPYLAWLGYAGFLLYQLDQLNPNAESLVPARTVDQIQVI